MVIFSIAMLNYQRVNGKHVNMISKTQWTIVTTRINLVTVLSWLETYLAIPKWGTKCLGISPGCFQPFPRHHGFLVDDDLETMKCQKRFGVVIARKGQDIFDFWQTDPWSCNIRIRLDGFWDADCSWKEHTIIKCSIFHFNLIMFDWCGILVFDNENRQSKATKGRNTDQTNNTDLDSLHSRRLESCWPSFLFMCCQQKWGPATCNILVAAHCLIQGSYLQPVVGSFWPQCFDGEWTMFPGSSKPSTRKIIGISLEYEATTMYSVRVRSMCATTRRLADLTRSATNSHKARNLA